MTQRWKRPLSFLLAVCMLAGLLQTGVYAARMDDERLETPAVEEEWDRETPAGATETPGTALGDGAATLAAAGVQGFGDNVVVSQTDYALAKGVTESHVFINTPQGTNQRAIFMTTVKPDAQATFKASYTGYYTPGSTAESRREAAEKMSWRMEKPSVQAAALEGATGQRIIMATNADYYNMQTARPDGYLIMEGNVVQTWDGVHQEPYFGVTKDGEFVIRDYGVDHSDIVEAISGPFYLVRHGQNMQQGNPDIYPVNSVGMKADGTVVTCLVDGRQVPYSSGMTMGELADFLIAQGVVDAIYLDGGGSASYSTRREGGSQLTMRSRPSDGVERTVATALMLISTTEGDGVFERATLTPNNEVYTPGSTVQFTATGVDKAGFAAELPASGLTWAVSPAEAGTVQNGLLTAASGYTGEATVRLAYLGETVGETTVQLQHPDEIYFKESSIAVDFGATRTPEELGLIARRAMREVHYKAEDFTWKVTGNVGTMEDGRFTSAGGTTTLNGALQVTYGDLTSTLGVEVGKMPVVLLDFEADENGEPQKAAHIHWGQAAYAAQNGGPIVKEGDSFEIIANPFADPHPQTITGPAWITSSYFMGAVPAAQVFRHYGYNYYTTTVGLSDYEAGTLRVVNNTDGQVRFGEYALEMNYDFRSTTGASNVNLCMRYSGEPVDITGYPTELGVWVYTEEGTPPFEIWMGLGYWDLPHDSDGYSTFSKGMKYRRPDGTESSVIRDAGWHYWYLDKETLATALAYQNEEHPLRIVGYNTLLLIYIPKAEQNWETNYGYEGNGRKHGSIYFDNYRAVYGTNVDDMMNPVITSFRLNNGQELTDETVLKGNSFNVDIYHNDPESENRSGIDHTKTEVLLDGVKLSPDTSEETTSVRTVLPNGEHVLTVRVYDKFGNYTEERRSFTVDGKGGPGIPTSTVSVTGEASAYLGRDYTLRVNASGPVKSATVTLTQLNSSFGEPVVTAAAGVNVVKTYTETGFKKARLVLELTGDAIQGGELANIKIHIPNNADENSDFMTYTVSNVHYAADDTVEGTSAQPPVRMPLKGNYTISVSPVVAQKDNVVITVTNEAGEPAAGVKVTRIIRTYVYGQPTQTHEQLLGATDAQGRLSLDTIIKAEIENGTVMPGEKFWLRANDAEGGLSFETPVVILGGGTWTDPWQGIHQNASVDPATQQAFSWLSDPTRPDDATALRYKPVGGETWTVAEAKRTLTAFDTSKTAAYVNTVALTGLTPATEYLCQIGGGETWSEERRFRTAAESEETTRFAVVGDTQMSGNKTADAEYLQIMTDIGGYVTASLNGAPAAFVLQTGDYVDNGGNSDMWVEIADAFSQSFPETDLVHVLGNHEYFGNFSGDNANAILNLPGRDYYSVEYGNVYVAVINNSANLEEAAEWLKEDAAKSDCAWKVLSVHQPPYYTNGAAPSTAFNRILPAAAEAAGIRVVFSGHDHAYARTQPLRSGQVDEKGITYFICGDLGEKSRSANYAIVDDPAFHFDFTSQEYTGLFLYVEATEETFTVVARDSENGHILDSVTLTDPCVNGHEYVSYDPARDSGVCAICGKTGHPKAEKYTGFVTRADGQRMYLMVGVVQTGWVQLGEEMHHFSSAGIWHEVTAVDTRSCTENGIIYYTCKVDGGKTQSQALWARGHVWDTADDEAPHTCTVCGTRGVHIREADFTLKSDFSLVEGGVKPGINDYSLRYQGKVLSVGNSRRYGDGYVEYADNTAPGTATLTVIAKNTGNFYGAVSKTFTIHPQTVTELTAGKVTARTIALTWPEAAGAERYQVYGNNGAGWELLDTVTETGYTAVGLTPGRYYRFKVRSAATVGETELTALADSPIRSVRTNTATADSGDSITALAYVTQNAAHPLQKLSEGYGVFLPAHSEAAPEALTLRLKVKEGVSAVNIQGDKGLVRLTEFGDVTVNVPQLATREQNGAYTLEISVDDGKAIPVKVTKGSGLNTLYLTSSDPENAGRDFVDADKSNKATGSMKLVKANGTVVYDGELTQIKGRGNSTFRYYDKKPYQIKLAAGADLLGTGESVKTWVLLANYPDATLLRDKLFKDLAAGLEMDYTPSGGWVELYYDGEYRGVYELSEKNTVGTSGVDIQNMEDAYTALNSTYGTDMQVTEDTTAWGKRYQYTQGLVEPEDVTGGYLLELNKTSYDEASGFITAKDMAINVKSPEWAGKAAMDYISAYYQAFETAVYSPDGYNVETGKYYYDYCDLESLVKMYLVQSLSGNCDAFFSSLFFYKEKGEKMYAGPIWDMEIALGAGWDAGISATDDFVDRRYLMEGLIKLESFNDAVQDYWPTFQTELLTWMGTEGRLAASRDLLETDAARNGLLWPMVKTGKPSVSAHLWPQDTRRGEVYTQLLTWLVERSRRMGQRFGESFPEGLCDSVGHTWDGGKVTTAATAAAEGVMTHTCAICGKTKTETIPVLPKGPSGIVNDPDQGSGGGGGIGGGGGDVITPPAQEETAGDVTVTVDGTVRGDTVSAKVDAKKGDALVKDAVDRKSDMVTVVVDTDKAVTEAAVTLPSATLGKLAKETQADLTVDTPVASVTIPNKSLGALDAPSGNVVVSVSRKEEDLAVEVTRNGKQVESVPGLVVRTAAEKEETGLVAVLVAADGTETVVKKSVVEEDGTLAILLNGSGNVRLADNRKPFDDVDGHWAKTNGAVDFVSSHELFQGVAPARFDADGFMSRAMLITVLHRLEDTPEAAQSIVFEDVKEDIWYAEAVAWGTQAGITKGMSENSFGGGMNITRQQLVTMLYRFAKHIDLDVTETNDLKVFQDGRQVESWATEAMGWAVEAGIMAGKPNGLLDANGTVTRGEAATMLMRLVRAIVQ